MGEKMSLWTERKAFDVIMQVNRIHRKLLECWDTATALISDEDSDHRLGVFHADDKTGGYKWSIFGAIPGPRIASGTGPDLDKVCRIAAFAWVIVLNSEQKEEDQCPR